MNPIEKFNAEHANGIRAAMTNMVLVANISVDGESVTVKASNVESQIAALIGTPEQGKTISISVEYYEITTDEYAALVKEKYTINEPINESKVQKSVSIGALAEKLGIETRPIGMSDIAKHIGYTKATIQLGELAEAVDTFLKAPKTRAELQARIDMLSDEMDANEEENRWMQSEIDDLYLKIDRLPK